VPISGVRHRPLIVVTVAVIVLAATPLVGAAFTRPDGRSVLESYLMAVLTVAAIQVGALIWLWWEIARHRQRARGVDVDHSPGTPDTSSR
jgi:hypothetical protein